MLKKVNITIPFTEALENMPTYTKFLKDILAGRRKLNEPEIVALTTEVSTRILNTPPKLKDIGSFTVPCKIGKFSFNHALCDLGDAVSLMPLSICRKLRWGELKNTPITLQLADRSFKHPAGILEDVPLQVGDFTILVDFVIVDMKEDEKTPLILGRPFLRTAGVVVDYKQGKLSLSVGQDIIEFNLPEIVKRPDDASSIFRIDAVNSILDEEFKANAPENKLEKELSKEEIKQPIEGLERTPQISEVSNKGESHKPKEDLKPLPSNLRYEFLDPNNCCPVIVNAALGKSETEKLLSLLRKHKKVIGYSIDDIKGIDPTICMHKIHIEEGSKPSVEAQRRLNPNLQEVVQKEISKLLEAGIIYPISDSKWVSPIQ